MKMKNFTWTEEVTVWVNCCWARNDWNPFYI